MLRATFGDSVQLRVHSHRALDEALEGGSLEIRQVFAGEETDEIRRGVDRAAINELHSALNL